MLLVSLLAAPALMVLATVLESRFGPAAAGWVAAAPVILLSSMLVVADTSGESGASDMVGGAGAHLTAQIGFAVAVALVCRRWNVAWGLLAGVAAFALVSWPAGVLPVPLAFGISTAAVLIARYRFPQASNDAGRSSTGQSSVRTAGRPGICRVALVRAGAAVVAVGVVLLLAEWLGPGTAGGIAAYPTFSTVLALMTARSGGRAVVVQVMTGLVRGLPAYLVFCLTIWQLAPVVGGPIAITAGTGLCLATYGLVVPDRRRSMLWRRPLRSVPVTS